ncbi:MAG: type VI secretion system baseplate subunit TssF [Desulfovibrio sp.]|uniref:type VI secretion system baseplate subunit TssF n=1 Tax=Desulfovibrio sp. 7SRBS1 TaxID=3378064 RepID=UPI003B3D925B
MINKYYQQELYHLRELAGEFSKAHPALAPLLGGQSPDPDVERLLEGSAFLTGMLREKLDDEFPEIVHGLMQMLFPHYLRPILSATIMEFLPKAGLMETIRVPAGTELASVPVDGTACTFRTSYDMDVHPLSITGAELLEKPGLPKTIRLDFHLNGLSPADWKATSLRLHCSGNYSRAADRYLALKRYCTGVRLVQGETTWDLPRNCIREGGFSDEEMLFPYPAHSYPGYRILQEFFLLPEKFLFLDITGLENWTNRGESTDFSLLFDLQNAGPDLPWIGADNFVVNAVPAVNLFPHSAEPIRVDHMQPEYRVRPSGKHPTHYQVFSVERVRGVRRGAGKLRTFAPFEMFTTPSADQPIYTTTQRLSPIRDQVETSITLAYTGWPDETAQETLSIDVLCTNASLPESLRYGDICKPTDTSPALMDFRNIIPPTSPLQPPLGKQQLWKLLSHLSLSYLSIADVKSLKALLELYIFPEGRDRARVGANRKRVEGVHSLEVTPQDRLVGGAVIRGSEITMEVDGSSFAGAGDVYLFGSVLNAFLAGYACINSYTRMRMVNIYNGEEHSWAARTGDRPLL